MQAFQLEKPDNLVDWWQESLDKYADRNLIGTKNKDGVFEWATRREINARIDHLRSGLALLGVSEGDAVGIIANNRLEWVVAAFATWGRIARYERFEQRLIFERGIFLSKFFRGRILIPTDQSGRNPFREL